SVPSAPKQSRAETAAALPLDEPIEYSSGIHGFLGGGVKSLSDGRLQPAGFMFVLPMIMAPDSFRRPMTSGSALGTTFLMPAVLRVKGIPATGMLSLTAIGTP